MLRAALYIRVSTEEQAKHGYSLQAQREALTKYALENNMIIVDYYMDDGHTARKKYTNRKEFMRMMNDVKQDKIDLILFIKLDRWFRSVRDYYKIQEILDQHKVNWKTIFENYDTTTASGRLHINIMLSVAQDESDRTSERIKFVFQNKIQKGEVITGSIPLGLKAENKRIVLDEENSWIVKSIFDHYELNQSRRGTIAFLRDNYGLNFSYVKVARILSNPIYKGEYHGILDFCKPLIDSEQFDRVQKILERKSYRRNQTDRIYIFSGLLTCAECGFRLSGAMTNNNYRDYNYYRCYQYVSRRLCIHKRSISEEFIEEYLINNIENEINSYIVEYEVKEKTKKPKIDKTKIKNKLAKLKELYVNDLIDIDSYKKDYELYNSQLQETNEQPVSRIDIQRLKDFLKSDFRPIYYTLNKQEKRALWRGILRKIKVDNEKHIKLFFI